MVRTVAGAVAVVLGLSGPACAWGDKGHRIVATIAESQLTPSARNAVQSLIGPSRLRDVAMWADHVRGKRPETAAWHYVDIPIDRAEYDAPRDCGRGDCVVEAVLRFERELVDQRRSRAHRAEALRFLTHLIADLHQPLHAADNRDRGGNDVKIVFFGEAINPGSGKPWNLHAVWDAGLIERRGVGVSAYARRLTRQIVRVSAADFERGTVVEWALEAHRAAVDTAYQVPPERVLSEAYAERSLPVVDEMLAKAGVRLAKVLNETFAR